MPPVASHMLPILHNEDHLQKAVVHEGLAAVSTIFSSSDNRQGNNAFLHTVKLPLPPIILCELLTWPTLLAKLNICQYGISLVVQWLFTCCYGHSLIIQLIIIHLNTYMTLYCPDLIFLLHTQLLLIECTNIQFIKYLKLLPISISPKRQ